MDPLIILPSEGKELTAFGDTCVFKLVGEQTGNAVTIALVLTPPGGGPPLHVHRIDHEIFIVESGQLEVNIRGDWKRAPAGSVVFLPKDVPHQFRNVGESTSRHWVVATPSGFEGFFEKAAELFAHDGPPNMEQILQAANEHGMEIVGPPPGSKS